MIKFFGDIYFKMMEALMCIVMIGFPIALGIMGAKGEVGGGAYEGFFLGAVAGALIGFVVNLCMVPFLQLMEIRTDVKKFIDGKARLTKDVAEIRAAVNKLAGAGGDGGNVGRREGVEKVARVERVDDYKKVETADAHKTLDDYNKFIQGHK